jgi:ketohexokinase
LLSLPWYPEEDQKLRATGLTTRVGGNIPNTLDVLSQVVVPVDRLVFVSVYAEKMVSKRLTDTLVQKSVEVNGIWRDCPENPRSWILRSEKTGSRTIVNYNG